MAVGHLTLHYGGWLVGWLVNREWMMITIFQYAFSFSGLIDELVLEIKDHIVPL